MTSKVLETFELTCRYVPYFLFSPGSHHWMTLSLLPLVSPIKSDTILLNESVPEAFINSVLTTLSGVPCPQVQFGDGRHSCPDPPRPPNPEKPPCPFSAMECGMDSCFTVLLRISAWDIPLTCNALGLNRAFPQSSVWPWSLSFLFSDRGQSLDQWEEK